MPPTDGAARGRGELVRRGRLLRMFGNRPQVVANYTKDIVYARLAPGILKELEARNPKNEKGYRKAKHYQWLTEDVGHPALAQHLYAVIGLMRLSDSWAVRLLGGVQTDT